MLSLAKMRCIFAKAKKAAPNFRRGLCRSLFGHEGQQSDLTGPLDGLGQLTLMHGAGAGGSPGQDLGPLGDVAAQLGGILVIDGLALVHTELADLAALAVHGTAGSLFTFHSHGNSSL